jgi:predicted Zn-dependent peptidase
MNIDKGYAFFDEFIAAINNVSAEELKDLANKYLNIEEMLTIVVGPEETTD